MKYLRKFETEADYDAFITSGEATISKSFVSLIDENNTVKYDKAKPFGAYIQHIDGTLYTIEEWAAGDFANEQANGVAIIDSKASFVIAKERVESYGGWGKQNTFVEGVFTSADRDIAKTDYNGESNTPLIAAVSESGAAVKCEGYTFPNGAKGYLAAYGEWEVAYKYKEEIENAMREITEYIDYPLNKSYHYWTSTQYSYKDAWLFYWSDARGVWVGKGEGNMTVPFTKL